MSKKVVEVSVLLFIYFYIPTIRENKSEVQQDELRRAGTAAV